MSSPHARSAKFNAVGYEAIQVGSPIPLASIIGLVQILPILTVPVLFPRIMSIITVRVFEASLIISIGSGLVLLAIRQLYASPLGEYEIEFSDSRDSGGNLTFTYTNTKGRNRVDIPVSRIDAHEKPLLEMGQRYSYRVKGTRASMRVTFSNPKLGLWLGFPDTEHLSETLEQLKWQAVGRGRGESRPLVHAMEPLPQEQTNPKVQTKMTRRRPRVDLLVLGGVLVAASIPFWRSSFAGLAGMFVAALGGFLIIVGYVTQLHRGSDRVALGYDLVVIGVVFEFFGLPGSVVGFPTSLGRFSPPDSVVGGSMVLFGLVAILIGFRVVRRL